MSLVVADQQLGNPLIVAIALADVARQGEQYPQLYALLEADQPERPTRSYLKAVEAQALQALEAHKDALKEDTVELLNLLASKPWTKE